MFLRHRFILPYPRKYSHLAYVISYLDRSVCTAAPIALAITSSVANTEATIKYADRMKLKTTPIGIEYYTLGVYPMPTVQLDCSSQQGWTAALPTTFGATYLTFFITCTSFHSRRSLWNADRNFVFINHYLEAGVRTRLFFKNSSASRHVKLKKMFNAFETQLSAMCKIIRIFVAGCEESPKVMNLISIWQVVEVDLDRY